MPVAGGSNSSSGLSGGPQMRPSTSNSRGNHQTIGNRASYSSITGGNRNSGRPRAKTIVRGSAEYDRNAIPGLPAIVESSGSKVGVKAILQQGVTTDMLESYFEFNSTLKPLIPNIKIEKMHVSFGKQHVRIICDNWDFEQGNFWDAKFWPEFCSVQIWRGRLDQAIWVEPENTNYFTICVERCDVGVTTTKMHKFCESQYEAEDKIKIIVRQRPRNPHGPERQLPSFVARVSAVLEDGTFDPSTKPVNKISTPLSRLGFRVKDWNGRLPRDESQGPAQLPDCF